MRRQTGARDRACPAFLTTMSRREGGVTRLLSMPSGPVPAILDFMDDTGTAFYVFKGDDGRNTTVAGENLEWMQDEALRRGITLEEMWRVMTSKFGERIWRHLNNG
jgi:hypothetical protein